jgi:hypothetical protein
MSTRQPLGVPGAILAVPWRLPLLPRAGDVYAARWKALTGGTSASTIPEAQPCKTSTWVMSSRTGSPWLLEHGETPSPLPEAFSSRHEVVTLRHHERLAERWHDLADAYCDVDSRTPPAPKKRSPFVPGPSGDAFLRPVADISDSRAAGTVCAAVEVARGLDPVTHHAAAAVLAHGSHLVDCAFEAVERMSCARRDYLECLVVFVAANFTPSHNRSSLVVGAVVVGATGPGQPANVPDRRSNLQATCR